MTSQTNLPTGTARTAWRTATEDTRYKIFDFTFVTLFTAEIDTLTELLHYAPKTLNDT